MRIVNLSKKHWLPILILLLVLSVSIFINFRDNKQTQNVLQKIPEAETASWQGKTTDWLGRTYDVNNDGNEYVDKDLKIASYADWIVPNKPYVINKGNLEKINVEKGWDSYLKAKNILNKADLTDIQKQYFYDNNYVPRSVEHFDVTGDGVVETVVTSLTLGCSACVDFYMTIFTNEGKYIARASEGTIIKTENGNGFYLTNYYGTSKIGVTIFISKYTWDKTLFTEIAKKELLLKAKNL